MFILKLFLYFKHTIHYKDIQIKTLVRDLYIPRLNSIFQQGFTVCTCNIYVFSNVDSFRVTRMCACVQVFFENSFGTISSLNCKTIISTQRWSVFMKVALLVMQISGLTSRNYIIVT